MLSDIELREVFHFCFLQQLLKISDPKIYILKGGVNLRFYFNSPRYSEDMDIDVIAGSVATLKKNGYKILNDDAFKRKLRTYNIQDLLINDSTKAKHTETTQRFRLRLVNQAGEELPTKIEFSRRESQIKEDAYSNERINTEIAGKYNRLAFQAQHYNAHTAILHKIEALAGRKQVEARDAFDIFILSIGGYTQNLVTVPKNISSKASEALLSISYQDYQNKVLEFLDTDEQTNYSGKEVWTEIQETVMELINR